MTVHNHFGVVSKQNVCLFSAFCGYQILDASVCPSVSVIGVKI